MPACREQVGRAGPLGLRERRQEREFQEECSRAQVPLQGQPEGFGLGFALEAALEFLSPCLPVSVRLLVLSFVDPFCEPFRVFASEFRRSLFGVPACKNKKARSEPQYGVFTSGL